MNDSKPRKIPAADRSPRSDMVNSGGDPPGKNIVNPAINEAQWPLFKKAVSVAVEIKVEDGTGAGVLLTSDGLILTAYHVVKGCKKIVVRRCSLRKKDRSIVCRGKYPADVVIYDKRADIAVLKLRQPPKNLPSCTLGNSDELKIGAALYRVGRDNIPLAAGYLLKFGKHEGVAELEVGMPNAPGASGGPVFNGDGEVVAIALRGNFDAVEPPCSYAIPINTVARRILRKKAVRELMDE